MVGPLKSGCRVTHDLIDVVGETHDLIDVPLNLKAEAEAGGAEGGGGAARLGAAEPLPRHRFGYESPDLGLGVPRNLGFGVPQTPETRYSKPEAEYPKP